MFGNDPDSIVHYLEEATSDGESIHATRAANGERSRSQERHERSVVRQNADLAIECRRDDRLGLTVEHSCFGGNDRDLHHELPSFSALATASSMPPTM